ncbi:hypothetical protein ACROYT_G015636 [Oculina patagonica]
MWHTFALSNILGFPIQTVYPEVKGSLIFRNYVNVLITPSQIQRSTLAYIMWAQTSNVDLQDWTPNHFVSLTPAAQAKPSAPPFTSVPKASKKRAQSPPSVPLATPKKLKYTGSFLQTHFSNTWTQQWLGIVAVHGMSTKFRCTACNWTLSCAKQGIKDVKDHLDTKAHQNHAKQLRKQSTLFQTCASTQNDIDKLDLLWVSTTSKVASRLVFIPFIVGRHSPNGLEAQLSAEAEWKLRFEVAPRALGALLALDVDEIINGNRDGVDSKKKGNTDTALFLLQLLTCTNPNIHFKQETPEEGVRKFNGIAVSLNTFLNILSENGDEPPSAEQLKNEINLRGIGMTKKSKQVFNASANGTTISRSQDENATKSKCKVCVFLKRNAFPPDAWENFSNFFGLETKENDEKDFGLIDRGNIQQRDSESTSQQQTTQEVGSQQAPQHNNQQQTPQGTNSQQPVASYQGNQQQAAGSPVGPNPAAGSPAGTNPAAGSTGNQQQAASPLRDQQPTTGSPGNQQPAAGSPAGTKPAAGFSVDQHPATGSPSDQQPATGSPGDQQPKTSSPGDQQQAAGSSSGQQPAAGSPGDQQQAAGLSSGQQPAAGSPGDQQPVTGSQGDQQAVASSPRPRVQWIGSYQDVPTPRCAYRSPSLKYNECRFPVRVLARLSSLQNSVLHLEKCYECVIPPFSTVTALFGALLEIPFKSVTTVPVFPPFSIVTVCQKFEQVTHWIRLTSLRPFDIHCGDYKRVVHGYRQQTGPFRITWSALRVEEKLQNVEDPTRRRRLERAYDFLMANPESSYRKFVTMQNRGVRKPFLYEIFSSPDYHGIECALWPTIYHKTSMCESSIEGQSNRASGKISFIHKISSPVADYSMNFELLQYQYDRWLFHHSRRATQTSSRPDAPWKAWTNGQFCCHLLSRVIPDKTRTVDRRQLVRSPYDMQKRRGKKAQSKDTEDRKNWLIEKLRQPKGSVSEEKSSLQLPSEATMEKLIIAKVCKEWPEEKETPLFGKNSTEGGKLMAFINQLAIDERFTYQKYGLGRNAIKDMILTHLRKRRRAQREDATLLDSTGVSTVSPSSAEYSSSGSTPPPSLFDKKGKNMCPISTQINEDENTTRTDLLQYGQKHMSSSKGLWETNRTMYVTD